MGRSGFRCAECGHSTCSYKGEVRRGGKKICPQCAGLSRKSHKHQAHAIK